MSGFSGFVKAAIQLGLESVMVKPVRGIKDAKFSNGSVWSGISAMATVEERHVDYLEITDHPIESGAAITDHAFKRPAEVILRMAWSNSPSDNGLLDAALGFASASNSTVRKVANVVGTVNAIAGIAGSLLNGAGESQVNAIYKDLLALQENRAVFTLYTGKRTYANMMCKTLLTETDSKTENALLVTMICQQIIIVNTQIVSLKKDDQKNASETASSVDKGQTNAVPVNPQFASST